MSDECVKKNTDCGKNHTPELLPTDPSQDAATAPQTLPDVFETQTPLSILHLAPDKVLAAIADIPDAYLELTEEELVRQLLEERQPMDSPPGEIGPTMYPPRLENRLRISFWKEYSRALKRKCKMSLDRIYSGVCSREHFVSMLSDTLFVAFLLQRPPDFRTALAEVLSLGVEEMREIMLMPVQNETGFVNTKLAELKFKIVEWAALREHGAPVQRVDQRNLNANITRKVEDKTVTIKVDKGLESSPGEESNMQQLMENIDAQIAALSAEVKEIETGTVRPPHREVLPIERNIKDKGKS